MEPNIYTSSYQDRDPKLWEMAQRQAGFKHHCTTYAIVNLFLWGLWFFNGMHMGDGNYPWPVLPSAGWGIGLVFHYLGVYVFPKENTVEKEYQKLLRNKK